MIIIALKIAGNVLTSYAVIRTGQTGKKKKERRKDLSSEVDKK